MTPEIKALIFNLILDGAYSAAVESSRISCC